MGSIEPSRIPGPDDIKYVNYESELQMPHIIKLIDDNLSEPYTIYTYRYFINDWAKLCFLAYLDEECVGTIVCKMDPRDALHEKPYDAMFRNRNKKSDNPDEPPKQTFKGYIAMLVVKNEYRKMRIGSKLVRLAVEAMRRAGADEIVLETESINKPAQKLYENLGFIRDKRLFRYYLNGLDALRLRLWCKPLEQEG